MHTPKSPHLAWTIAMILAWSNLQAGAQVLPDPAADDIVKGDAIAHGLCIGCHVVDTHSPVIRTDFVPGFPWIAHQDETTMASLGAFLAAPHGRMPDYQLNADEIRQVSAYILSMKQTAR